MKRTNKAIVKITVRAPIPKVAPASPIITGEAMIRPKLTAAIPAIAEKSPTINGKKTKMSKIKKMINLVWFLAVVGR